jgi:hypothetical protein
MTSERLSRLQRRILAWLVAHEQRFNGTMAASHQDLARTLAHDKGQPQHEPPGSGGQGLGGHHPHTGRIG